MTDVRIPDLPTLVGAPAAADLFVVQDTSGDLTTTARWDALLAEIVAQVPEGPRGEPGEPGAAGATGATGPQGDPGATGATGPKGDPGDPGATGATGPKGDQGDPGATGATGATGPQGDPGATGATGPKGDPGDPGATGANGTPGATGAAGPGLPTGGTTGQVPVKTSGVDYATAWANPVKPIVNLGLWATSATAPTSTGAIDDRKKAVPVACTPLVVYLSATVNTAGASVQITVGGSNLFASPVTLAAGTTALTAFTGFALSSLAGGSAVVASLTTVGTDVRGLTVEFLGREA